MNQLITKRTAGIVFREPVLEDAPRVYGLICASKPLDVNSRYLYMLQCSHFRGTCAVGFDGGTLACAVTGYLRPGREDTLFIWQIAVGSGYRNRGAALAMLKHLLLRPACRGVKFVEATVTPSNAGSIRLFQALARDLKAELDESPHFAGELFGGDGHEKENLMRVGPIGPSAGGEK